MKNKKKGFILSSLLLIALCLSLITGATFALFTGESKTTISVTSGKIDFESTVSNLKVYSPATINADGTVTNDDICNQNYANGNVGTGRTSTTDLIAVSNNQGAFYNGGECTLNSGDGTVEVTGMTPGDKLQFTVTISNNSTINVNSRLVLSCITPDDEELLDARTLFCGLNIGITKKSNSVFTATNQYYIATAWDDDNNNTVSGTYTITVELPSTASDIYQDLSTIICVGVEAIQNNAVYTTSVDPTVQVNSVLLRSTTTTNEYPHSAVLEVLEAFSATSSNFNTYFPSTSNWAWDRESDQFVILSSANQVTTNKENYYVFIDDLNDMNDDDLEGYSFYLTGSSVTGTVTTSTGFDVGYNTGITSINYVSDSSTSKNVVIYTCSVDTSLLINAPYDVVNHYGTCGAVDIIAVANSSYHEFGYVPFLEVSKGRVVLEETSEVLMLYFDTKISSVSADYEKTKVANTFDDIIVNIQSGVDLPEFSRDSVSEIPSTGTLVVEVEKENDESDYIYLYQFGLVQQIKVATGDSSTSNNNEKVAIDANALNGNDSSLETNTKNIATDIANTLKEGKSSATSIDDVEGGESTQSEVDTLKDSMIRSRELAIYDSNDEFVEYMSLSSFRDDVNEGNTYASYTIELLQDIDLSGDEWIPIGTSSNPFSGIFDGNNKTISNYKITSVSDNQGLFGYVSGIANADYNVDSIWNYDSKTFSEECIAESYYTAVIKNLKLSEVDVNVSSSGQATGGLVGKAFNTYISNIQMLSGSVIGYKQVGGVAGYLEASIIRECSNTSNFNVSLNDICQYTVAGIVGTTRSSNCATINCTNNASITGKGNTCIAGIVGQMTSSNSIIYGCINNGDVTGTCDSISTSESNCICGIAGQNAGAKYVVNCSNTGKISNTAGTYGQVSGIGGYRGGIFYNCSNSGAIEGNALYVAGISGGHSGNTNVTTLDSCSNTGSLSNSYDSNRIASYIGTSATVILKNITLQTPDDLNTVIYSLTGDNLLELDNVHFSSGTTWNYSVVNSLNVKINDNCDKPEIIIGNVNNNIGIEGNSLTITIPNTSTINQLTIKGNSVTLTNNGTISAGLVFGENSQNEVITNLGTIDTVSIKGSSNTFNNGDGDHTESSVNKCIGCNASSTIINNYGKIGEGANTSGYNVMNFDNASGSVVNNYGIIYGRGNNANYAIGLKESETITFNLYTGSKLIKRDGGWIIRSGATDMTLTINWAEGTVYTSEDGDALEEAAVNSISDVYEAGTTCTLTINRTKN